MAAFTMFDGSPRGAPRAPRRWLERFLWSLLVPGIATGLILRYLVPSRMEGARNGIVELVGRFGDRHPLVLGLALFIAVSETVLYWRRVVSPVLRFDAAGGAVAAAPAAPRGRRLVRSVIAAAFVALAIRSSIVETYRVISPSMLPTFDVTDRLLVSKMAYGFKLPFVSHRLGATVPGRSDPIVFDAVGAAAGNGPTQTVKRVIGLPGDEVSFNEGRPAINGWTVPACDVGPFASVVGRLSIKGRLAVEFLGERSYLIVWMPGDASFPPYRVQPNEVFVAGDNRGMSSDSRLWNDGRGAGVPFDTIQGRVSRILSSTRRDGRLELDRVLARPGATVHQPGLDLHGTEARIAACLAQRPAITSPPPPTSGH